MQLVLAIAVGGAVGALARHYVSGAVIKLTGTGFPWGTFAVNILGSLLMGFLVIAFALKFESSQALRGFLTIGLLGSFTTFSTYSLEGALLIERGDWAGAALYMGGSLIVGLFALFAGMWFGKLAV